MKRPHLAICLGLAVVAMRPAPATAAGAPRLIILTDIGGDPDDQQSLVRLLVHANQFAIEGLIASASGTPGELREDRARPDLIADMVRTYAQVFPNLRRHEPGFPPPARLLGVIKSGNPRRGRENVGAGHDTEGSGWIIKMVDRADRRPLNIAVWGGPTDLAQALWRVRQDRDAAGLRRFVARLRVHAIDHQDDSGPWILENFPDLFYILDVNSTVPRLATDPRSGTPDGVNSAVDRRESVYRGMYLGGDESLTSRAWIDEHVRTGHGPLGALYPDKTWTAPNPHGVMKEGDTPSWLYFLPSGLQDPAQPGWGGWGGRFAPSADPARSRHFRDAADTVQGVTQPRATVWRWRPEFQNAFAARMDWCVTEPRAANHFPHVVVNRHTARSPLVMRVRAGAAVALDARGSRDPDRDTLAFHWWHYPEAGSHPGAVTVAGSDSPRVTFGVPADASGKTIHLILSVSDGGSPPLTSSQRVVLNVL